jgi:prevent-host-death family protein
MPVGQMLDAPGAIDFPARTAILAGKENAMTTMTALEAKNAFGQFLDAVQRAPVTVTKNGREVGVMFSKADLEAMGESYLMPFLRDEVASGDLPIGTALLRQVEVNRRLALAEEDVAAGRVVPADDAFFERLREHVRQVARKE